MTEEARQRLISGSDVKDLRRAEIIKKEQETDEDIVLNISLRPKRFSEFVGQKDTIDNLKICVPPNREKNPWNTFFFLDLRDWGRPLLRILLPMKWAPRLLPLLVRP
jgi:hypothetical protein